jgi:hypothetical protein
MQDIAVLVADLVKQPAPAVISSKRGPTSNKYALELDGRHCGWLTDLAGAVSVGELGSTAGRYEELTLRCWPAMPRCFYEWVLRSFAPEPGASDGLLVLADDGDRELSRVRWMGGVVTEFATTAIDAGVARDREGGAEVQPAALAAGRGAGAVALGGDDGDAAPAAGEHAGHSDRRARGGV